MRFGGGDPHKPGRSDCRIYLRYGNFRDGYGYSLCSEMTDRARTTSLSQHLFEIH